VDSLLNFDKCNAADVPADFGGSWRLCRVGVLYFYQDLGIKENNNMNKVIDLLKNHRSIRKFKQEPVSKEKGFGVK
jgi:hypothetical protein